VAVRKATGAGLKAQLHQHGLDASIMSVAPRWVIDPPGQLNALRVGSAPARAGLFARRRIRVEQLLISLPPQIL
jgi:hypothetical protein